MLAKSTGGKVSIYSFADILGTRTSNEELRRRRAEHLAARLINQGLRPIQVEMRSDSLPTGISFLIGKNARRVIAVVSPP
jgi:outer membrane protein OmpA-like peptidoglycan-associated protein